MYQFEDLKINRGLNLKMD